MTNEMTNVEMSRLAQLPAIGDTLETLSGNPAPASAEARRVLGQVWSLSRDAKGCREVQDAIEMVKNDEECVAIADELRGHVWDAVCCPYANYVLQKCIVKLRSQSSQFIIEDLLQVGRVGHAARHKYGCRVLQRILEHCRADQVKPIVDELLADAMTLSKHPYASYVMQQIFEQGTDEHQNRLMEVLVANAVTLAADSFACAVMQKGFLYGDLEGRLKLASTILQDTGLIVRMARNRRGVQVVKLLMDLFDEGSPEYASIRAQLRDEEASLRRARYGRTVFGLLAQEGSSGEDA
jgi:hypothetical protein